ncbi:Beta-lactamase superfamily domain-containing protein [Butyrivibrio fibrisolvens DSM 3071]|uniref:Beta-lactamase superfamily domain-containing protein n=1 Tax=Butyrivibrio fibrisolvens DSM 3071 TaxID=1121131 RepID=A0A1M5Z2S2_BUTFI|nr:MBL fold metallo-hydrolase [Butyrivibrio fibrisolvens]SHI18556.1 Beta-lactamase superfamily domain-containing protein [Butyrivibrio fibrisolvens DSM 3071]
MTKLGFYNGLREIGGTFVVVETDTARCMFDFGFANADIIDNKVSCAPDDMAYYYVNLGILTPMDGIYDDKTAHKLSLKSFSEDTKENFFIISHMHIDHMGGLGMLDKGVPVYMSSDSLKLYRALARTGEVEIREHENCIGIDYDQSFTVGDITVKVVRIDHDVEGACGFIIKTSDGSICYTGDYRFHGFHRDITEAFADKCHGVDVMITEGVTASFDDIDMLSLEEPEDMGNTEEVVQEYMHDKIREEEGLIVINNYNRNVERIHRLISLCKAEGRTLVLEPVQAEYVKAFYPEDEISVYAQNLDECSFDIDTSWTKVTRQDLLTEPSKYVLQQDYKHVYELIELKDVLSLYVHMDGAPLGDYDPSYKKLHDLMEQLSINYEHKGTGGHSRPYYIRYMIDHIEPGTLIPLHSFRPEQVMSDHAGCRILPEYGDFYTIENGKLEIYG